MHSHMVVQSCNFSTCEVEVGITEVQSHLCITQDVVHLWCIELYHKVNKENKRKNKQREKAIDKFLIQPNYLNTFNYAY